MSATIKITALQSDWNLQFVLEFLWQG